MFSSRFLIAAVVAAGVLFLATDSRAKPAGDKAQADKAQGKKPQQKKGAGGKDKKAQGKKAQDKKAAGQNKKPKDAAQKFDNPVGKKFKDLDSDQNGFLSIEEIFGSMPKRGTMPRNVFEAADRDGNDWMNAQEFLLLQRILVAGPEKVLGKNGGKKPAAKKGAAKKPAAKKGGNKKGGQARKKKKRAKRRR
jgi:hypothetical protein